MANISKSTQLTIRIDHELKRNIDALFKNLGLNTSSAIMMFLKQCEREQGIPFIATMDVPNKKLLSALEESEDIISDKVEAKRYKNFDDLVMDID